MESVALIAAPQVLTGSFALLGAARVFATPHSVALWLTYARDAGSATGRPLVRVDVSPDPTGDTWFALPIFDTGSFSAGAVDLLPLVAQLGPSAGGTSRFIWPDIALRHGVRFRLMVADLDGANPGTLSAAVLSDAEAP